MAKKIEIPRDNNIIITPIEEAMPDNYLPYAVEVAKDRALPDVRDGLKPVHRRILYGAYLLRALPDKAYFKSARIVGDILGKYHPHGDTSVYDSMVILAQDFTTRETLIDGQGNWGSIDGDNAAAMRYTEARLTPLALEMLRDIEKGIVKMVPNYAENELEPEVLPSRYPNILVNGAFGIAVGLATNIPPHNLREVSLGFFEYIKNPNITIREMMKFVKGPDLPTGGIIIGDESLINAYEKGEGKVVLRAKAEIETLENGRLGIVITEFPYRKSKAKLLQSISDMTGDKKHSKILETISDIRDESDRNGIRAVIEFKKAVDFESANKILKYLYKKTDLQMNISFNMVMVADGKPQTLGLLGIFKHYLKHQKAVIRKRTEMELNASKERYHIVEGFIKAIAVMDEVIAIIRSSTSKKNANENLMQRFGFSEKQSNAILELMLYRLTGLELVTFEKEYNELTKHIAKLEKILGFESELLKIIQKELMEIIEKFGNDRRTKILKDEEEGKIEIEELLVDEDVVITVSKAGFAKRISKKNYDRYAYDSKDIEYREDDEILNVITSNTKNVLLVFTNIGNMYKISVNDIIETKFRDKGERLDNINKYISFKDENIVSVFSVREINNEIEFSILTTKGATKKITGDKINPSLRKINITKLNENDEIFKVFEKGETLSKAFEINTREGLIFTVKDINFENLDRNALPRNTIKIGDLDNIINIKEVENEINTENYNLEFSKNGTVKKINYKKYINPLEVEVNNNDEILIFMKNGDAIKLSANIFMELKSEVNIKKMISGIDSEIIYVCSTKDYSGEIYFFTKKGMVRKSLFSEYKDESSAFKAYKLKSEKDCIVSVEVSKEDKEEVIIISKNGLGIKFSSEELTLLSKNASGVIGMSLKENDTVFCALLKGNKVSLEISNKTNKVNIKIQDIVLQGRALRGKALIQAILGDEVTKVRQS